MGMVKDKTKDFFENSDDKGLQLRRGQIEMADEVCTALETHKALAVEAEVGIGKSYAYLIPAVYEFVRVQKQIVIATSTIALQEQLNKDSHNVLQKSYTPDIIGAHSLPNNDVKDKCDLTSRIQKMKKAEKVREDRKSVV